MFVASPRPFGAGLPLSAGFVLVPLMGLILAGGSLCLQIHAVIAAVLHIDMDNKLDVRKDFDA